MSEHFIKNIEIKNFKCFEDFKAEGFGRVNLIGGKNNVGKTAFMESIEVIINSNDSYSLAYSLYQLIKRRQSHNRRDRYFELDFIYKDADFVELKTHNKHISIQYSEDYPEYTNDISKGDNLFIAQEPSLTLSVNKNEKIFPIERIINRPMMARRPLEQNKETNINFVSSTTTEEKEIAILYGKLVDLNKEKFLDESLQLFDSNILGLKQKATDRDIVLKLLLEDRKLPVLLSSLGEGINRFISILSAIWASQGGYLFIDEIENGLHYSNYEKLWKIILLASREAKCQLFITTHSKECIASFNKVQKELNSKNTYYFEMAKNGKTDKIFMTQIDSQQLEYELRNNERIRGE